ncbi:MAG: twin transmembrane helix small protein [Gammaproteobacteria bacterium]
MTIKTVAIVIFIAIIASLGSALFHLVRNQGDEEQSRKTAKALTVRIGLSVCLFILLFLALASGLFRPTGIGARIQQAHSAENNPPASNP